MLGVNKRIIGKISSLPINITIDNNTLEYGEYKLKFDIGPILLNPGPILPIHERVAEKLVKKSNFSNKHNKSVHNTTIIT